MAQVNFKLPRPVKGDRPKVFASSKSAPSYMPHYESAAFMDRVRHLNYCANNGLSTAYAADWCRLNGLKV